MAELDTLERKKELYDLYCKNRLGGIVEIGRNRIHIIVDITSATNIQVTARHYNEKGKCACLQWMEIIRINGKELVRKFEEQKYNG